MNDSHIPQPEHGHLRLLSMGSDSSSPLSEESGSPSCGSGHRAGGWLGWSDLAGVDKGQNLGLDSCPRHSHLATTSRILYHLWFPSESAGKESSCNAGDASDEGSIPGLGKSPERGNGNLLQHSCLKNPMDRGAWWATVHGVAKNKTRQHAHIPPLLQLIQYFMLNQLFNYIHSKEKLYITMINGV